VVDPLKLAQLSFKTSTDAGMSLIIMPLTNVQYQVTFIYDPFTCAFILSPRCRSPHIYPDRSFSSSVHARLQEHLRKDWHGGADGVAVPSPRLRCFYMFVCDPFQIHLSTFAHELIGFCVSYGDFFLSKNAFGTTLDISQSVFGHPMSCNQVVAQLSTFLTGERFNDNDVKVAVALWRTTSKVARRGCGIVGEL
jgi:hypothetical protein